MKRIVFTGGVFAGKTTVLTELKKMGYTTVPECGIVATDFLINKMGSKELKNMILKDYKRFADVWLKFQKQFDKKVEDSEFVFYDRHYQDLFAFSEFFNGTVSDKVKEEAKKYHYDYVFLFETLSSFDARKETGRITNTKEASDKQREFMKKRYEEVGYKVIKVKEMSIKQRVEFILNKIKSQ